MSLRSPRRTLAALAAACLVVVAGAGAALADDIANDLDPTVDAVAETMALTAGGDAGTTTLYVKPTNGDGKQGCNLTGGTSVTIALTSSSTAVATVSPSSVTFTSCGDTHVVTVTPVAEGSATVSASVTRNATVGTFDVAPVAFRVDVAPAVDVDTTPPVVSYTLSPASPDGLAGWYRSDVVLDWTVVEAESPDSLVLDGCQDVTVAADQAETVYTCGASSAGGTAVTQSVAVKRDATAPEVSYTGAAGTAGSAGWYTSPVTATFTATDALSGPASATATVSTGTAEGSAVVVQSPEVADLAGNVAAAGTASASFQVDLTDPTATFDGSLDGEYFFGEVPAAPGCTAADDVSGPAGCVVTGYGTAVGTHTLVATATDVAGRTATSEMTYTVKRWTTRGFFQPVDMKAVNTVKGGSTVPVKFELFASSELTDTAMVSGFTAKKIACDSSAPLDEIEVTATGGTVLRYDAVGGQFVYNWKVPTGSACYALTMTAKDGSTITAAFRTR